VIRIRAAADDAGEAAETPTLYGEQQLPIKLEINIISSQSTKVQTALHSQQLLDSTVQACADAAKCRLLPLAPLLALLNCMRS
jgi:hypothetical protein